MEIFKKIVFSIALLTPIVSNINIIAMENGKDDIHDMGEGKRIPHGKYRAKNADGSVNYDNNDETEFANGVLRAILGANKKGNKYKNLNGESFKSNFLDAIQDGALTAVGRTSFDSTIELLRFIPTGIKSVTSGAVLVLYKFVVGYKPLDWNMLGLLNNKIYDLLTPYTQASLGNFSKEKEQIIFLMILMKIHGSMYKRKSIEN